MKFDESTISAAKLEEWAQIERDYLMNAPPVGAPVTHNGRNMLWFVGADLHVDAYVWADHYALPEHSDQHAITAHINKLVGDVEIHFEDVLL
jgi:hypothetical protein